MTLIDWQAAYAGLLLGKARLLTQAHDQAGLTYASEAIDIYDRLVREKRIDGSNLTGAIGGLGQSYYWRAELLQSCEDARRAVANLKQAMDMSSRQGKRQPARLAANGAIRG